MYIVYILFSSRFCKTYVGITTSLDRRITQHNNGYHTYTKRYVPWEILYVEYSNDRVGARRREKYLKTAAGRRWIKKHIFGA